MEHRCMGISVIVPTYNREQYIKECLDSILAQEYNGPLEIVVCDDGSTDKTLEIAESYGPPVVVLRKPEGCKDQGPAPTRNRGVTASTQPLLALLDSDDKFFPGHLDRLAKIFRDNQDVMMAFDEAVFFRGERAWNVPYLLMLKERPDTTSLLLEPLPQTNAVVFRRSVLDHIGTPFSPDLLFAEDNDFRLRIAERFPVMFCPGLGSGIREHEKRSIYTSTHRQRFFYDMQMINRATQRHAYPGWVVRARKAKLYYSLAKGYFSNKNFLRGIYCLCCSCLLSPELYCAKLWGFPQKYIR